MKKHHPTTSIDWHRQSLKLLKQIDYLEKQTELNLRRAESIAKSWIFSSWAPGYRADAARNAAALECRLAQYAAVLMLLQEKACETAKKQISGNRLLLIPGDRVN